MFETLRSTQKVVKQADNQFNHFHAVMAKPTTCVFVHVRVRVRLCVHACVSAYVFLCVSRSPIQIPHFVGTPGALAAKRCPQLDLFGEHASFKTVMFPGANAKPYYALQTGQIDVVLGPQASKVVLGAQYAGLDRGAPFAKSRGTDCLF